MFELRKYYQFNYVMDNETDIFESHKSVLKSEKISNLFVSPSSNILLLINESKLIQEVNARRLKFFDNNSKK